MKRKHLVEWIVVAVLGIGGLFVWEMFAAAERMRLIPPPTATTLETFAEAMPPPRRLALVDESGETKLVWIGNIAWWSLPSGPSCYVFDDSGKLIQWDLYTNDAQPTNAIFVASHDQDEISLAEAFDFIGGR